MSPRQGECPGAIPGSRTIQFAILISDFRFLISEQAARQHAAESPKLRSLGAAPRQPAKSQIENRKFFGGGRGRQAMRLPCKQVDAGALPADSTIRFGRESMGGGNSNR
jgi:hypothetical protein